MEVVEPPSNVDAVVATLIIQPSLRERIVQGQASDKFLCKMRKRVLEGSINGFSVASDGALVYEGRICVPKEEELRKVILDEAHSTPYTAHPGGTKMYQDLRRVFWWRSMKRDIEEFVEKCLNC